MCLASSLFSALRRSAYARYETVYRKQSSCRTFNSSTLTSERAAIASAYNSRSGSFIRYIFLKKIFSKTCIKRVWTRFFSTKSEPLVILHSGFRFLNPSNFNCILKLFAMFIYVKYFVCTCLDAFGTHLMYLGKESLWKIKE